MKSSELVLEKEMKESLKILIVEDERIVAEDIKKTLKDLGYVVSSIVYSAVEAIKEAEETKPDLVLMDIKLRGNMDGVDAARHIRARFDIPCVYITALSDREIFQRAKMAEPFGYIHKPVERKELCTAIEMALYRYNMEKKLKESEEKYRSLTDDVLDSSKVGIFIIDSDFRVVWMNSSLESYFGIRRDEVIGKDKRELILRRIKTIFEDSETFVKKVLATYNNNTYIENFECHVIPDNNREERWLEHWSQPICSGLFAGGRIEHYYNISQAKRAEKEKERLHAQLAHSEKMAGIGTLASGIAHEFNNLLQIMRGHVEFAQKTKRAEDVEEALDRIVYNADRAAKIIKDLLVFTNPEVSEKEMCNITEPLESALSLIESQLEKKDIKVLRKYNRIPKIEVNRAEMQQVFLNMITNARDSMLPEGGKLEIRVKQAKQNVEVSFTDSGKGINEENLKRLFEPFFTTKGALGGNYILGTGLGLSVSYGIVKRHGGTIKVDNKQNKGTAFTIKLPIKKSD